MDAGMSMTTRSTSPTSFLLRMTELAGLIALIWGLAASLWWLAVTGAVVIGISYAAFHRRRDSRNGHTGSSDSGPLYFGDSDRRDDDHKDDTPDDGDSGGDSGGGDGGGGD